MMKLPSVAQIGAEYKRTLWRFPLVLSCAILGVVVAIILVQHEGPAQPTVLFNLLLASILAIPFLTAIKLATERAGSSGGCAWIGQLIGAILIVIYALSVPTDLPRAPMYHVMRFAAFAVACCLLLSILPFWRKGERNGFWHFNRIIVFRIVLAGVFAVVLFGGLALALAALDNLFGMEVPAKRYFELWILTLGFFVVPFILAGIPEDLDALEAIDEYPRPVKLLGQYVLPPLVLVYFVILYAYIAKIIVVWSWPQGWVGRLILGFSATGILALFVLDPLREKLESLWIKKASRWYYLILLPVIVVLFLALWRRISEYGLTEDRYLGLAAGTWLIVIAGYFLLSRTKSIKIIPASLCVFTFLIAIGPWGMFSVSEQSQIRRLKEMLVADSILVNSMVQKATSPVPVEHEVEISAILSYLHEVHGFSRIEPWFAESLRPDTANGRSRFTQASEVAEMMGVKFNLNYSPGRDKYLRVAIDPNAPIMISGYDQLVRVEYHRPWKDADQADLPDTGAIEIIADSVSVTLVANSTPSDSLVIPLRPLFDQVIAAYDDVRGSRIPGEKAVMEYESADHKTKVVMLQAHFEQQDSVVVAGSYDALVLYSRKGRD